MFMEMIYFFLTICPKTGARFTVGSTLDIVVVLEMDKLPFLFCRRRQITVDDGDKTRRKGSATFTRVAARNGHGKYR
jgi:hypothetical protein